MRSASVNGWFARHYKAFTSQADRADARATVVLILTVAAFMVIMFLIIATHG